MCRHRSPLSLFQSSRPRKMSCVTQTDAKSTRESFDVHKRIINVSGTYQQPPPQGERSFLLPGRHPHGFIDQASESFTSLLPIILLTAWTLWLPSFWNDRVPEFLLAVLCRIVMIEDLTFEIGRPGSVVAERLAGMIVGSVACEPLALRSSRGLPRLCRTDGWLWCWCRIGLWCFLMSPWGCEFFARLVEGL
jgi:hypothetical protein